MGALDSPPEGPSLHRKPNLDDTARLFEGPLGVRSLSLTGLFILACFYTLYFARDFFLPVTLAVVFNFLLAPVVRLLKTIRIPGPIGSAVVIGAALTLAGFLAFELSGPLGDWLAKVPETGAALQAKASPLKKVFDKLSNTSDQLEKLARSKPEREPRRSGLSLKELASLIAYSAALRNLFLPYWL